MRIRAAGLVPVASASGPLMTRSETVTLLNDMCVLAPAALVAPSIQWEAVDARRVRATYTNAGQTIHAELEFDDGGELVNFVSDDRGELAEDGRSLRPGLSPTTVQMRGRWSTPMGPYRMFPTGPSEAGRRNRLSGGGEARYARDGLEYAYIKVEIDEVRYNLDAR